MAKNTRQEVPWQAFAILAGMPDATEKELQDAFGNGRISRGLVDPAFWPPPVGMGLGHTIVLCIAKETYPIKCFVSWNGF